MKAKATVVWIALGCLAAGMALAGAAGHHGHGPDMQRLAILLDLNDYQKTEVEKILKARHEQMRSARAAAASAGERPTREQMRERHQQLRQETLAKLGAILDAQQMKKFEVLTEHRGRHGHGRPRDAQ